MLCKEKKRTNQERQSHYTKGRTDLDIEEDNDAAILHYIANAILNLDDAELFQLPNQIIRTNQNKYHTSDCGLWSEGFQSNKHLLFSPCCCMVQADCCRVKKAATIRALGDLEHFDSFSMSTQLGNAPVSP
jgi:hypothetical protein